MSRQIGARTGHRAKLINAQLARQQVEEERSTCLTCSAPAQEQSKYCLFCQIYWEECAPRLFYE